MIDFIVRSEPAGQMRPRVGRGRGGHAQMFKHKKEVAREGIVMASWIDAGSPRIEGRVPIRLEVYAYLERPRGHFKKSGDYSAEGLRNPLPLKKPDLTNVAKMVEDVLNDAGAWQDDSYVVAAELGKYWSDHPANPLRPFPCTTVRAYPAPVGVVAEEAA